MMQAIGRLILLVEEDVSMRSALQRLLCAIGFVFVAFVSAESLLARGPGLAEQGRQAGAGGFLAKPFEGTTSIDAIHSALSA
jgi:FixJ family two-component response regulator